MLTRKFAAVTFKLGLGRQAANLATHLGATWRSGQLIRVVTLNQLRCLWSWFVSAVCVCTCVCVYLWAHFAEYYSYTHRNKHLPQNLRNILLSLLCGDVGMSMCVCVCLNASLFCVCLCVSWERILSISGYTWRGASSQQDPRSRQQCSCRVSHIFKLTVLRQDL